MAVFHRGRWPPAVFLPELRGGHRAQEPESGPCELMGREIDLTLIRCDRQKGRTAEDWRQKLMARLCIKFCFHVKGEWTRAATSQIKSGIRTTDDTLTFSLSHCVSSHPDWGTRLTFCHRGGSTFVAWRLFMTTFPISHLCRLFGQNHNLFYPLLWMTQRPLWAFQHFPNTDSNGFDEKSPQLKKQKNPLSHMKHKTTFVHREPCQTWGLIMRCCFNGLISFAGLFSCPNAL